MLELFEATQEEIAAAFAKWETEYRQAPDGFYTAEETAAMEVAPLAERQAITFLAYLRSVKGGN